MFLLKKPNKNGTALIYAAFSYHGRRFIMSADLTINPADWDKKRERPRRGFKYYSQYDAILDRISEAIETAYLEWLVTKIPTLDELRAAVKAKLDRHDPITLAAFASSYADQKRGAQTTIWGFKNVAKHLAAYSPKLRLDDVDLAAMVDFRDWLLNQDYEPNTVQGYFKRLKTILNAALEQGATTNRKWQHSKAKATGAETTAIFLNEAELEQIRSAPMPDHLDKYRDVLLITCYTGTRFSDIWKIGRESFDPTGRFFRITDTKENAVAQIPAHPVVMAIMAKYDWKPPKIGNVVFNRYVKDVGKAAKIDTPVIVTRYPGGIRSNQTVLKYQLITAHTGRRSLICNLLIAGLNRETIKTISGHRSDAAFNKYIRLTPSDHLRLAFKSSFFQAHLKAL